MTPQQLDRLLSSNPDLARANPQLTSPNKSGNLGIGPQPPHSSSNSTSSTSPAPPAPLPESTKALKSLQGQERAEHDTFMAWLVSHGQKDRFLHAPTFRKVHDLPPGWPDFTLFRAPSNPFHSSADTLFIELKVHGGSLSEPQTAFIADFPGTKLAHSADQAITLAAAFLGFPTIR